MARYAEDLYLYNETISEDFKRYNLDELFKYKKTPWASMLILLLAIIVFFIGLFTELYILVTDIIFIGLFIISISKYFVKRQNAKINAFIQLLLENNKEGFKQMSPLIPLYLQDDRKNQHLILNYQDKNYIDLPYSDIKSYKLLVDKVELKNKKLNTTKLDFTARSYIVKITLSNDNEINIGFSNAIKKLAYEGKYVLLLTENTKTINSFTSILDDIVKSNK